MKKLLLMTMLIGLFLLSGCSKIKFDTFVANDEDKEQKVTQAVDEKNISTDKDISSETANTSDTAGLTTENSSTTRESTNTELTPTPSSIQPPSNIELPIYTINIEGVVVPATALVSKDTEITPQLIVDKVLESLADQSIVIGVKPIITEKTNIIVNFEPDKTPDKNMGSSYEGAILNAIAQSLIDNFDDYKGVIFRIDDEAYTSGAYELGIDEIFLGDN